MAVYIDKLFQVHRLNADGVHKAEEIAETFTEVLRIVTHIVGTQAPDIPGFKYGREMNLVRTHLELASFYAKKAMASQEVNQQR